LLLKVRRASEIEQLPVSMLTSFDYFISVTAQPDTDFLHGYTDAKRGRLNPCIRVQIRVGPRRDPRLVSSY
jgi:hypothetical protein